MVHYAQKICEFRRASSSDAQANPFKGKPTPLSCSACYLCLRKTCLTNRGVTPSYPKQKVRRRSHSPKPFTQNRTSVANYGGCAPPQLLKMYSNTKNIAPLRQGFLHLPRRTIAASVAALRKSVKGDEKLHSRSTLQMDVGRYRLWVARKCLCLALFQGHLGQSKETIASTTCETRTALSTDGISLGSAPTMPQSGEAGTNRSPWSAAVPKLGRSIKPSVKPSSKVVSNKPAWSGGKLGTSARLTAKALTTHKLPWAFQSCTISCIC